MVEAFDQVLATGSILATEACPVLDVKGNPLEKDGIYQYQDKQIKVRRWEFGAGNILDKYYRVFYTDNDLKDTFLVVEGRYPSGVFGGAVYHSTLSPIQDQ